MQNFRNRKVQIKKIKASNTYNYISQKKRGVNKKTEAKRNNIEKLAHKELRNNIITDTFYPSWGKSKYNIPYINKMVYGEDNSMDPFEQLQKDLFFEVKSEIKKANSVNKKKGKKGIYLNGKNILNRFKINDKSEIDENEAIRNLIL